MASGIKLFTLIFGDFVGEDEFGNRYYRNRTGTGRFIGSPNKERRWVVYKGVTDPSKIPPSWHGWIHYMTDKTPEDGTVSSHKWEKPHQPNLTGTSLAYFPAGHPSKGGKRQRGTGDYDAWNPETSRKKEQQNGESK